MSNLRDLVNISKKTEDVLIRSGIENAEMLKQKGSREAFLCILEKTDPGACINLLCALEGAIRGIRWFYLPDEVKKELKSFLEDLKGKRISQSPAVDGGME